MLCGLDIPYCRGSRMLRVVRLVLIISMQGVCIVGLAGEKSATFAGASNSGCARRHKAPDGELRCTILYTQCPLRCSFYLLLTFDL